MIQTETSKAKIIFVSVPNDAECFELAHSQTETRLHFQSEEHFLGFDSITLPQGNWTILNVLDDVTEDDAAKLVGSFGGWYARYGCYEVAFDLNCTAIESLQSLATSLGVEGKTIILYQLK